MIFAYSRSALFIRVLPAIAGRTERVEYTTNHLSERENYTADVLFHGINSAGLLMEAKRKTCVVTFFDEETKAISYRHIPHAAIAEALGKSSGLNVPLEDFDNKVDDEFARKFGAMILRILAGRSPFLKEHLSITTGRDPDGADETPTGTSAPSVPMQPAKRKWFSKK